MDEGETKTCENCKREIPAVNFTIHAVHCARNIGVCPACKEPVPLSELPQHHDKMHKLLPCAQCGERVCGADLEDHVRDSCAHTMRGCRYCALELRRGELPAHERYCGARTERCTQCGEWVMHKYRQLHLDSNHGFIRLDDDPVPTENAIKTTNVPKPLNVPQPLSSTKPSKPDLSVPRNNINRPLTEIRYFTPSDSLAPSASKPLNVTDLLNSVASSKPQSATTTTSLSTSRDQNINCNSSNNDNISRSHTNGPVANSVANKQVNGPINLPSSSRVASGPANLAANEGAKVVNGASAANASGAVPRVKRSNHQPQLNTSAAPPDKVNKDLWSSRGAVKKRPAPAPPGRAPPPPDARRDNALQSAARRRQEEEHRRREQTAYNLSVGLPPVLSATEKLDKLRRMDALQHGAQQQQPDLSNVLQGRVWGAPALAPAGHVLGGATQRTEAAGALRDLKPMSAEQFARRFSELQLPAREQSPTEQPAPEQSAPADRFSQIKSSLRELRRDLNEVTAPYNANNTYIDSALNGAVRLPCEFCGAPVLQDDLVLHQTGCRPDLAQYRAAPRSRNSSRDSSRSSSRRSSRHSSRHSSRAASPSPVIPCEFCTAPLPVYLISEHQERCGREANLLFPD